MPSANGDYMENIRLCSLNGGKSGSGSGVSGLGFECSGGYIRVNPTKSDHRTGEAGLSGSNRSRLVKHSQSSFVAFRAKKRGERRNMILRNEPNFSAKKPMKAHNCPKKTNPIEPNSKSPERRFLNRLYPHEEGKSHLSSIARRKPAWKPALREARANPTCQGSRTTRRRLLRRGKGGLPNSTVRPASPAAAKHFPQGAKAANLIA
jgi:hypothetical protein